ncbi:MAG: hypothetical protein PVH19_14905 [Planctomycetia bacterium]|jgi:hypothetical protein
MNLSLSHVDRLLQPARLQESDTVAPRVRMIVLAIVVYTFCYGLAMGSSNGRPLQMLYSGMKLPMLIFATCLICQPVFFMANTLAGLRNDFREATRAIWTSQAVVAITLASLTPLALFWYISFDSYRFAVLMNAFMMTIATVGGQIKLWSAYRQLIARNRKHRIMVWVWLLCYAFVGIQMGWLLRPFIGSPGVDTTFFRPEAFSNAYVVVFHLIFG